MLEGESIEDKVLREAVFAEQALRSFSLPCPPPKLYFASSLMTILSTWRVNEPSRLDDALRSMPNVCLLASLTQDTQDGGFVVAMLVESGEAATHCLAALESAVGAALIGESGFNRGAIANLVAVSMAVAARGGDASTSSAISCAIARRMGTTLTGEEECNMTAIALLKEGARGCKRLLQQGLMPPLPMEPVIRMLAVGWLAALARCDHAGSQSQAETADAGGLARSYLHEMQAEGAVCSPTDFEVAAAFVARLSGMLHAFAGGHGGDEQGQVLQKEGSAARARGKAIPGEEVTRQLLVDVAPFSSGSSLTTLLEASLWQCLTTQEVYDSILG